MCLRVGKRPEKEGPQDDVDVRLSLYGQACLSDAVFLLSLAARQVRFRFRSLWRKQPGGGTVSVSRRLRITLRPQRAGPGSCKTKAPLRSNWGRDASHGESKEENVERGTWDAGRGWSEGPGPVMVETWWPRTRLGRRRLGSVLDLAIRGPFLSASRDTRALPGQREGGKGCWACRVPGAHDLREGGCGARRLYCALDQARRWYLRYYVRSNCRQHDKLEMEHGNTGKRIPARLAPHQLGMTGPPRPGTPGDQ